MAARKIDGPGKRARGRAPTGVPLTARERRQVEEQRRMARAERARLRELRTVPLTARERRQVEEQRRLARAERARLCAIAERELELERRAREIATQERALRERERRIERTERRLGIKPQPPLPPPAPAGRELTERQLENLYESMAEQWDIPVDVAESLVFDVSVQTHAEVTEYIQDLYDALDALEYDIDISDLWDMYYGYPPRGWK